MAQTDGPCVTKPYCINRKLVLKLFLDIFHRSGFFISSAACACSATDPYLKNSLGYSDVPLSHDMVIILDDLSPVKKTKQNVSRGAIIWRHLICNLPLCVSIWQRIFEEDFWNRILLPSKLSKQKLTVATKDFADRKWVIKTNMYINRLTLQNISTSHDLLWHGHRMTHM